MVRMFGRRLDMASGVGVPKVLERRGLWGVWGLAGKGEVLLETAGESCLTSGSRHCSWKPPPPVEEMANGKTSLTAVVEVAVCLE